MWQPVDGGSDAARREERQQDRHMDVPLAASLPFGDPVDGRRANGPAKAATTWGSVVDQR
jgi:hypothetical protein